MAEQFRKQEETSKEQNKQTNENNKENFRKQEDQNLSLIHI